MELGPAFTSLESVKGKVNFVNGLRHPSNVVGGHAKGAAGILTGRNNWGISISKLGSCEAIPESFAASP